MKQNKFNSVVIKMLNLILLILLLFGYFKADIDLTFKDNSAWSKTENSIMFEKIK